MQCGDAQDYRAGTLLRYVAQARGSIAVILITHNPYHAYPIGDRFKILKRGGTLGAYTQMDLSREKMTRMMLRGEELEKLEDELRGLSEHASQELANALHDEDQVSRHEGWRSVAK
jgi:ABC-type sugar transport system ATPase subunit